MESPDSNITGLLMAWSRGNPKSLEALTPLVYDHLHMLARRYMALERPGHTLQTTALVNEAFIVLRETARILLLDKDARL